MNARKSDDAIYAWLIQIDSGTLSDQDASELDEWLDEDPANRIRLAELGAAWFSAPALEEAAPQTAINRIFGQTMGRIAVALSLVAVAVFVGYATLLPSPDFYVERGAPSVQVELPDGTTLLVGPDTAVNMHYDTNVRGIELRHGRIQVVASHDSSRPLIVDAGDGQVEVTGTEFTVRHSDDETLMALQEGSVVLRAPPEEHRAVSGQSWKMKDGAWQKVDSSVSSQAAWTRGSLQFRDATIDEVLTDAQPFLTERVILVGDSEIKVTAILRISHLATDLEKVLIGAGLRITRTGPVWVVH